MLLAKNPRNGRGEPFPNILATYDISSAVSEEPIMYRGVFKQIWNRGMPVPSLSLKCLSLRSDLISKGKQPRMRFRFYVNHWWPFCSLSVFSLEIT